MLRTIALAEKLFLILDDNKFHPYYTCRIQRLVKRDEARISKNGMFNIQNAHYGARENPHTTFPI